MGLRDDAILYSQKWRWYERNALPWNRARIHWHFMKRRAFVRWPVEGNVLEALDQDRLEIGEHTLLEPGVWITAPGDARVRIGSGCFLNRGVMVAAMHLVECRFIRRMHELTQQWARQLPPTQVREPAEPELIAG